MLSLFCMRMDYTCGRNLHFRSSRVPLLWNLIQNTRALRLNSFAVVSRAKLFEMNKKKKQKTCLVYLID